MAEIDRLEVQIEAEAKDANAQLDKMLEKLEALSKKLESISKNNGLGKFSSNTDSIIKNVTGINKFATGFTVLSSSIKDTGKQALGLAFAFGKVYAGIKLIQKAAGLITKSIDISSRLTEVQNVVDVTFGRYQKKIEELASGSIENFGMSELTIKEIASRFQAMGTAMGFSTGKMSEMSVGLTKLAADMASFYNVDQEKVAKSLESVFTGQTRPLRTYGLDLSQATLKEWALKQGIDADIQAMSQAEKTLLRYQYVMENTSAAQGDFARTSNTWANQVRILQQQLQALAGTIGDVFINALKPMVAVMNRILEKVREFAKMIADSLGTIFGWTIDVGTGGLANDFSDIEDSTENTAGNLGQAAAAAKKLKTVVLGIDELNINNPNDDSGSGSGYGGISEGIGGSGLDIVKTDNVLDKWKSEIDNLYDLGAYIGSTITEALNSIEWEKVYESARNFGKGLADFLNGLISPELFGAVGRTIASCLNTAIYGSLSFAENFDWSNLGQSVATGINNFFETFDFASAAETLNTWAQGLFEAVKTAVANIKWDEVLKGIYDFFSNIDISTVGIVIGVLTLKNVAKVFVNQGIIKTIGNIISELIMKTPVILKGIRLLSSGGLLEETGALSKLANALAMTVGGAGTLKESLTLAFGSISTIIAGIISVVGGAVLAVTNFFSMWKDGFNWIKEALMVVGVAIAAIGAVILGAPALVAAAIAGIVAAVATAVIAIKDNWENIKNFFVETFDNIYSAASNKWNEVVDWWNSSIGAWWNENVSPWFTAEKWKTLYQSVKESLKSVWNETVVQWANNISKWWDESVAPWFTLEKWKNLYASIKSSLKTKWDETVLQWKSSIQNWWNNHVAPWFTVTKWVNAMSGIKEGFKESFRNAANAAIDIVNRLIRYLNEKLHISWDGFTLPNGDKIGAFSMQLFKMSEIPHFAEGGYPEKGQLFMARENGMNEYVGSIGNRSAVANNDQIVAGIKQGVYEAMTEAMQYMMSQSTEQPIIVQTTVEMDGKAIVQQTDKARRRMGWNFQPI